uniref:Uncharacterized protein n=1 Tax=Timema monikensis TaxID=170555 RepID=A0A7R9E8S8_9NEOP|nr:unnamed protein product [Timema monikensis]
MEPVNRKTAEYHRGQKRDSCGLEAYREIRRDEYNPEAILEFTWYNQHGGTKESSSKGILSYLLKTLNARADCISSKEQSQLGACAEHPSSCVWSVCGRVLRERDSYPETVLIFMCGSACGDEGQGCDVTGAGRGAAVFNVLIN